MTFHFRRELEQLKTAILSLSAVVEESVWQAVNSVDKRDAELAQKVIDGDPRINALEVEIEEEALKLLALYQPVANDLRFVITIIKMNNDLERIGDLAVNIAERSLYLATRGTINIPLELLSMAGKTRDMLRMSLDALVNMDTKLARKVCLLDEEVDQINGEIFNQVKSAVPLHLDRINSLLNLMLVARHLERIADLSTNIAEDVIYLAEGVIIRHQGRRAHE